MDRVLVLLLQCKRSVITFTPCVPPSIPWLPPVLLCGFAELTSSLQSNSKFLPVPVPFTASREKHLTILTGLTFHGDDYQPPGPFLLPVPALPLSPDELTSSCTDRLRQTVLTRSSARSHLPPSALSACLCGWTVGSPIPPCLMSALILCIPAPSHHSTSVSDLPGHLPDFSPFWPILLCLCSWCLLISWSPGAPRLHLGNFSPYTVVHSPIFAGDSRMWDPSALSCLKSLRTPTSDVRNLGS